VTDELVIERTGPVTRLTLNRPHKANALSAELVEALIDAVDRASADDTRLLVFAGAEPHFCAGFDFTGFEESSDGDLAIRFIRIETLLQQVYHAPFTTLALAHGKVFGAGADLIIACDGRIAAPQATFRLPGLLFDVVLGTRRLADRVGTDNAREILSTAKTFSAETALRFGFLTRSSSVDEWDRVIDQYTANCFELSSEATAALHHRTRHDTRAADMAALARSVSTPGLKNRIRQFRAGQTGKDR
jgi:enoyl-CoA hydratase/carnithine racemase